MDFLLFVAAFLIGILIRPALVALARGEAIKFSMNYKYFGFSLRIGPSHSSAVTPHSGTPLVPRPGPPPLSRAALAVSDRPNGESSSARCLLPGRGWDGAAPGRAPAPLQGTGHRGAVPVHRELQDLSRAPGTAGPSQSIGHHGTIPVHRAPRAGNFAKTYKRKPTPVEEPKEETLLDEKSGEHTTPGDEPKKERNSDKKSWDETDHGDEPKDGDGPEDGAGGGPEDGPGGGPGNGPDNGPDDGPNNGDNPGDNGSGSGNTIKTVLGATAGAGLAVVGLPLCVAALGFTGAGIAAGSFAAKMMSAAAIANGGGVAAGSTVAVLQSIGAAGLSAGAKAALGSAGAAAGAWFSKGKKAPSDQPKKDKNPSDQPKKK
ncbi:uncharacterized protein LOC131567859 [Ammospiza caudacuta]|uniref:uncharacterized protein LOC131567859 n=1 Tax=Ammospiza caudacuta TaxID=2857398 RepID=UPI0027387DCD|nr:uncharacterized protein LOC131567859 [Ammospiza caudacuta]